MFANQAKRQRTNREAKWDSEKQDAGGEGSRGGRIIGRTKSGKPIYSSHGHPTHEGFTKMEHNTAANIHMGIAEQENKRGGKAGEEKISEKAKTHFGEAAKHRKSGAGGGFEPGVKPKHSGLK